MYLDPQHCFQHYSTKHEPMKDLAPIAFTQRIRWRVGAGRGWCYLSGVNDDGGEIFILGWGEVVESLVNTLVVHLQYTSKHVSSRGQHL